MFPIANKTTEERKQNKRIKNETNMQFFNTKIKL